MTKLPLPRELTVAPSLPRLNTQPTPLLAGAARFPGGDAWVTVLRNCRWPTQVLVLDFETYFDKDYSLKKLSTIEYIMDARFEIIGLASLWIYAPFAPRVAKFTFADKSQNCGLDIWRDKFGPNLEKCTVVCQNARFDMTVLAKKYGIFPPHIVDTLNLSRHLDARARHSLKTLCERYNLTAKGDTSQFLGQHLAQVDQVAMARYSENDAEREMDLMAILLPQLTRPEVELPLQVHTLEMYTQPKLGFDFEEAERVVLDMQIEMDRQIAATGLDAKTLSGNISFVAALEAVGVQVPMKKGKKKLIAALAKNDEGLKELKKHPDPRVRALIAGRQAVKSWPLHIRRVEAMARQAKANGGMFPNALAYNGAHTGRWSGGEGVNTQNLSSRGSDLSNRVRGVLIASPSRSLVVADAAQIEARVLAWLAGQDDLLGAFERGEDIYSQFASEVLAQPVRKALRSDPPPVVKVLSTRRMIGKVGILGLGYGMGKNKALEYMRGYPELSDKIDSGEIDLFFTTDVVNLYRQKFPKIVALWGSVERAFKMATKYGQDGKVGPLKFHQDGTTVAVTLPSGRCLFYPHARVVQGEKGEELRWHWGHLWGGTLVENIVQAISRDILAEAILNCEKSHAPIGHHIHDEVVAVVPSRDAESALRSVLVCMKKRPSWASNLPLDAEGFICSKYGKQ